MGQLRGGAKTMWTAAQVGFILVALLLVCFIAGKKIGERRISRVHEEMKALEKSFNQLLEQMELVSSHNLKVLEVRTEELRDMLHAADKKCLYANDLLQEIENARRDVQSRLTGLSKEPASLHEKKLRTEIQALLEELQKKILLVESRLDELERASRVGLLRAVPDNTPIAATAPPPPRAATFPDGNPRPRAVAAHREPTPSPVEKEDEGDAGSLCTNSAPLPDPPSRRGDACVAPPGPLPNSSVACAPPGTTDAGAGEENVIRLKPRVALQPTPRSFPTPLRRQPAMRRSSLGRIRLPWTPSAPRVPNPSRNPAAASLSPNPARRSTTCFIWPGRGCRSRRSPAS